MSEAEEAGTEGAKRGATQVKGASRAGSDAAEFLPAAKPTGLVETNSASFFLSFFLSKKMQKKLFLDDFQSHSTPVKNKS